MTHLSIEDQQALNALRHAVAEALDRKRRLGQYAVIWRDGRVVRVEAEAIASLEKPGQSERDG
jgi:hypothetical protein